MEDESRIATVDKDEEEDGSILDGFPEVWDLGKLAQEQQDDPELGPVYRWLAVGDKRPAWEDIADFGVGVKSWWSRWDTLRLCRGVLQVKWARADGPPHLEDRRPAD